MLSKSLSLLVYLVIVNFPKSYYHNHRIIFAIHTIFDSLFMSILLNNYLPYCILFCRKILQMNCRVLHKHIKQLPKYLHSTAHTHTMETHSMEKVPSMENFSINQTE